MPPRKKARNDEEEETPAAGSSSGAVAESRAATAPADSDSESGDDVGPPMPPADGDESSDDDDVGPPLPPGASETAAGGSSAGAGAGAAQKQKQKKRKRRLSHEALYLSHLPRGQRYSQSFMHRDTLARVSVTPAPTDFVVTASVDGHVKFWKKQAEGIEFVKHYRAHLGPIVDASVSADGALYASISSDGTVKVFDVANFGQCGEREEQKRGALSLRDSPGADEDLLC